MLAPISKHLEVRQKYSAARRIFNALLCVWKSEETLSLVIVKSPHSSTTRSCISTHCAAQYRTTTCNTLHVIKHKATRHRAIKHWNIAHYCKTHGPHFTTHHAKLHYSTPRHSARLTHHTTPRQTTPPRITMELQFTTIHYVVFRVYLRKKQTSVHFK